MTTSFVIDLGKETLITCLMVVGPLMIVGFVVGLTISVIQAVMQIQEMTMAFVPKLLAMGMALLFFGHWMLTKLMLYTQNILGDFRSVLSG